MKTLSPLRIAQILLLSSAIVLISLSSGNLAFGIAVPFWLIMLLLGLFFLVAVYRLQKLSKTSEENAQ